MIDVKIPDLCPDCDGMGDCGGEPCETCGSAGVLME